MRRVRGQVRPAALQFRQLAIEPSTELCERPDPALERGVAEFLAVTLQIAPVILSAESLRTHFDLLSHAAFASLAQRESLLSPFARLALALHALLTQDT
jgi:hypothetical protein